MAGKRLINRVSVEASFFKKLSPMENLLYAARLYGVPARVAREEVVRMLDVYRDCCHETLAMPVIRGIKTESERFAGAIETRSGRRPRTVMA